MSTCANCKEAAVWQYNIAEFRSILYCGVHLPRFLRNNTPESRLVSKYEEPVEKPATTTKKKKVAEPVEETVVDEEAAADGDS